jgi:hypothetical protein
MAAAVDSRGGYCGADSSSRIQRLSLRTLSADRSEIPTVERYSIRTSKLSQINVGSCNRCIWIDYYSSNELAHQLWLFEFVVSLLCSCSSCRALLRRRPTGLT